MSVFYHSELWPQCPHCGTKGTQDRLTGTGDTRFSCPSCGELWTEKKGWTQPAKNPCEGCDAIGCLTYCETCSHYRPDSDDKYEIIIDKANKHLTEALDLLRVVLMAPDEVEMFFLGFLEEN